MVNFIELNFDIFDKLQEKYLDRVALKDTIYYMRADFDKDTIKITTPSNSTFHILSRLLYRNGKVCVQNLP